jgi:hypothetical protein
LSHLVQRSRRPRACSVGLEVVAGKRADNHSRMGGGVDARASRRVIGGAPVPAFRPVVSSPLTLHAGSAVKDALVAEESVRRFGTPVWLLVSVSVKCGVG